MMESVDEGDAEEPLDSVFGDLDCNDNTPVLQPETGPKARGLGSDVSPTKAGCITASPMRSSSQASTISESHNMASALPPGLLYSPEDTLNNDFFYDDEFTIQFDANLAEPREVNLLADDLDVPTLLSLSRMEDNKHYRVPHMVTSKSDTCLYQADLELSCSDHDMSQELSISDRECITSSEMSDLRSEPLFSPPPGNQDSTYAALPIDSQELSASFAADEKYNFDFTAHKDQYTLCTYDISPSQAEGQQQESQGGLTSWAQRSTHSQLSWGSGGDKKDHSPSSGDMVCYPAPSEGSGSPLTTWGQVKRKGESETESSGEGMTTWKKLQETSSKSSGSECSDQCVPDLQSHFRHRPNSHDGSCFREQEQAVEYDEDVPKRTSLTLFELFQRHKSQSDDSDPEGYDTMISPTSLQKLTGTWSMSAASTNSSNLLSPGHSRAGMLSPGLRESQDSHGSAPSPDLVAGRPATINPITYMLPTNNLQSPVLSDNSPVSPSLAQQHLGMVSWSTVTNLNTIDDLTTSLHNSSSMYSKAVKSGQWVFRDDCALPACKRSFSPDDSHCNISTQAGSQHLTESKLCPVSKQDCCVQFPPNVLDCSVQTSFEDPRVLRTWESKCLQTSAIQMRDKAASVCLDRANSVADPENVIMSAQAEKRLTKSLFFTSRTLPDLSFLNKAMCSSATPVPQRKPSSKQPVPTKPSKPLKVSSELSIANPVKQHKSALPVKCTPKLNKDLDSVVKRVRTKVKPLSTGSRESSPSALCGRPRSSDSTSTASVCSSSSSGIDPGNSEGRSLSEVEYYSPGTSDCTSTGSDSGAECMMPRDTNKSDTKLVTSSGKTVDISKVDTSGVVLRHPKKKCSCTCSCGRSGSAQQTSEKGENMATSHPMYKQPRYVRKGDYKQVEYLQVSPVHQPYHSDEFVLVRLRPSDHKARSLSASPIRVQQHLRSAICQQHGLCSASEAGKWRDHSPGSTRKPLKSCLVKRRRNRHAVALKHRSWSDPYDGKVLKYNQEGQTKYQLVTNSQASCGKDISQENDREEKLIVTYHSLPSEVLEEECGPRNGPDSHTVNRDSLTFSQEHCDEAGHPKMTPLVTGSPSPDQIPLPACACATTHAVLHSSSDSTESPGELYRGKKSVSFSAEVSYHSPYSSPHQSPHRQKPQLVPQAPDMQRLPIKRTTGVNEVTSIPVAPLELDLDSSGEGPPNDFLVSPTQTQLPEFPSVEAMSTPQDMELKQKKELAADVIRSVETILAYFNKTNDPLEKVKLGSTIHSAEIGELLLRTLCPAVHALMLDGLRPHIRSLFGKVKNNVWRVIEEAAQPGPSTRVFHELVADLKSLTFLSTPWIKFNAFIFGLLNHRGLDFWLTYLHNHEVLLKKHYNSDCFLAMSSTSMKAIFLEVTRSLQQLNQVTFRLEYNFEYRSVQEKEQQKLSSYILEKHVSMNTDVLCPVVQAKSSQQTGDADTDSASKVNAPQMDTPATSMPASMETDKPVVPVNITMDDAMFPPVIVPKKTNPSSVMWLQKPTPPVKPVTPVVPVSEAHNTSAAGECMSSPPSSDGSTLSTTSSTNSDDIRMDTRPSHVLRATGRQLLRHLHKQSSLISQVSLDSLTSLTRSPSKTTVPGSRSASELSTATNHGDLQDGSTECLAEKISTCGDLPSKPSVPSEGQLPQQGLPDKLSEGRSLKGPTRKAVSIVKNNEITLPEMEVSDIQLRGHGGFLSRFTKHIKQIAVPDMTVYKQGLTNYEFEERRSLTPGTSRETTPVNEQPSGCPKASASEESLDNIRVAPQQETRSLPMSSSTPQLQQGPVRSKDDSKRLSDNVSSAATSRRALFKKSWSSFGPTLINMFDKLLLDSSERSSSDRSGSQRSSTETLTWQESVESVGSSTSSLNTASKRRQLQQTGRQDAPFSLVDTTSTTSSDSFSNSATHLKRAHTLCHYLATEKKQLSFEKGTTLAVLAEVDSDWLLCYHGNKEGLVHRACISMED